jgi:hypothetical protein
LDFGLKEDSSAYNKKRSRECHLHIHIQQLYFKEEEKCRIMNIGRDYPPNFRQNNPKKRERVVFQNKTLDGEL